MAVTVFEEIQETVSGVARMLMAESGKSMVEVWDEALSIYRVQFETEVLKDEDGHETS
jgi:hypothetical protein